MSEAIMDRAGEAAIGHALNAVDKIQSALKSASPEQYLMRSSIDAPGFDPTSMSIHQLEQHARAMRSAYLLRIIKSIISAVENWFERRAQRDLEDYLAASQNLADLESRMRRYADKRLLFNAMGPHYD
jgi:hypothetical protein